MDALNNLNVIIGIIVGIFGIGGYLVGVISYLRNKVTASQQQHTAQLQASAKQPVTQTPAPALSKLDWMEVLWLGFEDCLKARGGTGVITSIMIGIFGGAIIGTITAKAPTTTVVFWFTLFYLLYFTANLLFYMYFVGRRIEKKVASKYQTLVRKARSSQSY